MLKLNKLLFLVCILSNLFYISNVFCKTSPLEYLLIAPDARSTGMAEAYVAMGDDVNSIYYNPAGTAGVDKNEFSISHLVWFAGFNIDYFSMAIPLKKAGVVGGYFSTLWQAGEFKGYDPDGNETVDRIPFANIAFNVSYATPTLIRNKKTKMYLGLNFKYIYQKLNVQSSSSLLTDAGMFFKNFLGQKIQFGIAFNNLPLLRPKYGTEYENSAFNFRIGFNYHGVVKNKYTYRISLIPALDYSYYKSNSYFSKAHIGLEFKYRHKLARIAFMLRSGYKLPQDNGYLAGLSVGAGFEFRVFSIDYSFIPYGNLGLSHRITILFKVEK